MSEELGPRRFGHPHGEVFLGRDFSSTPDYSDEVAASIDGEVRHLLDGAHGVARTILAENRAALDALAAALIEHETLEADQVRDVLGSVVPWTHDRESGGSRPTAVATSDHPGPGRPPSGPIPNGRTT
jgi:cell division protease FtsH